MLKLDRCVGEKIMIGDDIEVVILRIDRGRGQCRIGIKADRNITIIRGELLDEETSKKLRETPQSEL